MQTIKKFLLPSLGTAGTAGLVAFYAAEPVFPTPDKLLVLIFFTGLMFGKAKELMKRLVPFVVLITVYDMFRGFADYLNQNVSFVFMADFDKALAGGVLPTRWLQDHLWNGQVQFYDLFLYGFYMLHFVAPLGLAILVWAKYVRQYWRVVMAFTILSFGGFLTFVAYPAAPPWMASDLGYIESIDRVSSSVWHSMGVHDFPTLYNQISPNPVAAVPSLHTAYSVLFCVFVFVLFKSSRYKWLALVYPASIMFGTVYMGEHYIFDVLLGAVYAFIAYYLSKPMTSWIQRSYRYFRKKVPKIYLKRV